MLRQYPVAHYERRPLECYPAKPERICGDILEIGPGRGEKIEAVEFDGTTEAPQAKAVSPVRREGSGPPELPFSTVEEV